MPASYPSYLALAATGELGDRISRACGLLADCGVCPRHCGVDRTAGELGYCRGGLLPRVSSAGPHFGEEPPLVGRYGSGTIFLAGCNMRCAFCQNYGISQCYQGEEIPARELAGEMLALQERGCHNINLVSPSHFVPQILSAVGIAVPLGLAVPLVYNSGGYDLPGTLRLLDGVFDIYMPDLKFMDGEVAEKFCRAKNYPEKAQAAIQEMHRQVGDLEVNPRGVAERGLLVRHLVLPGGLAGTREAMHFLAREISPHTYVNLMAQYRPCGQALENSPLNRRITDTEYEEALRMAREEGIHRLDQRPGLRIIRFI